MPSPIFCIVGAGLAGGRAAISLRQRGFDGRLVLLGQEPDSPYERPPLSKAYLNGELPRAKLFLQADDAYLDQSIEWHPETTVGAIDLRLRRVRLTGGESVEFDSLLLATGSRPRTLELPGVDLAGIRTYRTLADAESLQEELKLRPQVVVVGGGFLGTELASAARRQGCSVTIVEAADRLLAPLGEVVGDYCAELHRQAQVRLLCGEQVERFIGSERVEHVRLSSGRLLPCDLALICVGAVPNSELALKAGLTVDPGVVVWERCRTDHPEIFAAGDVASWWSPRSRRQIRVEHYDNAVQQGIFVAGSMLGDPAEYNPIPYFWTEQYGAMVQQVGVTGGAEEAVIRGDPGTGRFSVFYLEEGRLHGCVAVNRFPDLAAARRLITAGVGVSAERLRDLELDLRSWSQDALESADNAGA
ncbi:MAG: FAD-dependent oxidoreductase [Candidatus Dormiibacterota bacterium]